MVQHYHYDPPSLGEVMNARRTLAIIIAILGFVVGACSTTNHVNEGSGGSVSTGGESGTGGQLAGNTGTSDTGGSATAATGGYQKTGGSPAAGGTPAMGGRQGSGGTVGSGGSSASGVDGGAAPTGKIFSQCRFHFGTTQAKGALIAQLDFFTPGWMMGTFGQKSVCTNTNPGGSLAGLVPVDVTYISANYVKNKYQLCDCNVAGCAGGNLCQYGSQYITQEWANIIAIHQQLDGVCRLLRWTTDHFRNGAGLVPVYWQRANPALDRCASRNQHDGHCDCT
jgi:hypothetical protein